jgi:predicted N-acetyltransferase YhbS
MTEVAVMDAVEYAIVQPDGIDVTELASFYTSQQHDTTQSSTKLRGMLERSCCVVTARSNGALIGVARGTTDGVNGYLAECKLDPGYQGPAAVTRTDGRIEHDERGIAREMAIRVLEALRDQGVERIHVLAYGTEVDFCEELGFRKLGGLTALQLDPAALPAHAGAR